MRTSDVLAAYVVISVAGAQVVAAQAGQAPKPGPEHARLAYFVGKWKTEGEMKPSPMGPGGKMTATDTCEWYDGHFSVVCRSDGTGPWGPTKSIGILGYSTEEKAYTYYGVDNSPMTMSTVPKGTVQGKTWTYTDESLMGGKKVKSRVTINEVSPTEYTFKYEMQGADGKWVSAMESKSTKM